MKNMKILCCDPSLSAWGWAVVHGKDTVIDSGCIKTEPEAKKRKIRDGEDTARRITEINNVLEVIRPWYNVSHIVSEVPSGSQNSKAAKAGGIVLGIIQTYADMAGLGIEYYLEREVKQYIFNRKTATKDEMIQFIKRRYHVPWTGIKYKDEAIADALSIHHTALRYSPVIKAMMNS